ncbi:MAG: hypothetical protein EPN97_03165 [Alphaproteobacteria bacterium]|nr:MAG: hypothetical protein EPN97_03165 [Alphaproteobacteria bacterium]
MKIYGKDLSEVLAEMPWQFKVIVMAGMIWIPFALIHAVYIFATIGKSISKPGIVNFAASPVNAGVADPSMTEGPDKKTIYMALTMITRQADAKNPAEGRWSPSIRLASSNSPCKLWNDMGEAIASEQQEIIGPDGVTPLDSAGVWWLEHPALIHDPTDPNPIGEYKLFYYKYLWLGPDDKSKQLSRRYWMIAFRHTNNPVLKDWKDEQWIFGGRGPTAEDPFGAPPEPYGSLVQYHLNDFDPSLKDMFFYARPSAAVVDGVIYMTLSAFFKDDNTPNRVIMVSSADHARTWHYVGTLLTKEDVAKMGPYTKLGGGSLIQKKGKLYFAAVLGDDKVLGLGSFIIPFEDASKALLKKDQKTGAPAVINKISRVSVQPTLEGGGYAAYSDLCKGLYVSEFSGLKKNFHIFSTQKDPVEQ